MAKSLRDLRRKMKAIKSTRQVTKAMELVSASKMRRATQNAVRLRTYAITAWRILQRIADLNAGMHPYLEERKPQKMLAVVFTSDRGLCGSLNANMLRRTTQYIQAVESLPTFEKIDFVAVGRKGAQYLRRMNKNVIAAFPALSNRPSFKDALPIVKVITDGYLGGQYDNVTLLYMDFISPLVQEAQTKVLLPMTKGGLRDMLVSLMPQHGGKKKADADFAEATSSTLAQYQMEPSAEHVLGVILPQLTELQVYQAILESAASEHSARMVAMRSATDNASNLLADLSLTYNQTRQAGITAELAELSASKAALD